MKTLGVFALLGLAAWLGPPVLAYFDISNKDFMVWFLFIALYVASISYDSKLEKLSSEIDNLRDRIANPHHYD